MLRFFHFTEFKTWLFVLSFHIFKQYIIFPLGLKAMFLMFFSSFFKIKIVILLFFSSFFLYIFRNKIVLIWLKSYITIEDCALIKNSDIKSCLKLSPNLELETSTVRYDELLLIYIFRVVFLIYKTNPDTFSSVSN